MITIYRNDHYVRTLTFTGADGVAIDITGYTIKFTVRTRGSENALTDQADESGAIIAKTITSHTDAVNGVTTITLTPEDTGIDPDDYTFDIQMKDTTNIVTTVQKDIFRVLGDITLIS